MHLYFIILLPYLSCYSLCR